MEEGSELFNAKDDVDRLLFVYSERNAAKEEVLKYWKEKLSIYCRSSKVLSFKKEDIINAFTRFDILPSSFVKSVDLLIERGEVSTKDKIVFEKQDLGQYLITSTFSFLSPKKSPASQQYVSVLFLNDLQLFIQQYICTLDEKDCVFLVAPKTSYDAKFSFGSLLKAAGERGKAINEKTFTAEFFRSLKGEDVKMIVDYMLMNNKAFLSEDGSVVKVLKDNDVPSSIQNGKNSMTPLSLFTMLGTASTAPSIKESEIARLKLSVSIQQVELRVSDLEKKATDYTKKALEFKLAGNTTQALMNLNLKRNTETVKTTILSSLMRLTQTMDMMDESDTNVLITQAYTIATNGLRSSRAERYV